MPSESRLTPKVHSVLNGQYTSILRETGQSALRTNSLLTDELMGELCLYSYVLRGEGEKKQRRIISLTCKRAKASGAG